MIRGHIMNHEYGLLRSQLKGYLFEIFIMELLRKNQFNSVDVTSEPGDRVRENRVGFIEFKGRGCWHQIDCPCDYNKLIPFSYPLRLLGEAKFYRSPLSKEHIREYIGVLKDIQENYFVADGIDLQNFYPRKLEIGVYFSANGFQAEAEKLAYAHGIRTISYKNNPLINRLKLYIEELEINYLSVNCLKNHEWNTFRQKFVNFIRDGYSADYINERHYFADGYEEIVQNMRETFVEIKSSFIATTATGVFIHFIGESDFPGELFQNSDRGTCRIYYNYDNSRHQYFWMEISGDASRRRFYFTPPESLDRASVFGGRFVLNEKERIFQQLNININIDNILRALTLELDQDWLDAIKGDAESVEC